MFALDISKHLVVLAIEVSECGQMCSNCSVLLTRVDNYTHTTDPSQLLVPIRFIAPSSLSLSNTSATIWEVALD